ncbi:hypothetical protein ACKX2L_06350 [Lachnospiraceae bacterium YH-ros2228]
MLFQKKQKPIHFIFRDYDDSPITEVWVSADRQTVRYQNYKYDKTPVLQVFNGKQNPTWQDVLDFFEERCFPRGRSDIKDILKSCHLKEYDPEALVRYFKGRFAADHCWIDFIEEK